LGSLTASKQAEKQRSLGNCTAQCRAHALGQVRIPTRARDVSGAEMMKSKHLHALYGVQTGIFQQLPECKNGRWTMHSTALALTPAKRANSSAFSLAPDTKAAFARNEYMKSSRRASGAYNAKLNLKNLKLT
jgi:hypothetical protein